MGLCIRARLTRAAALAAALIVGCAVAGCTVGAPTAEQTHPAPNATSTSGLPASAPVVLFLGDSYTAGTGLAHADAATRWPTQLSVTMGWREVNAGCNGSGYTRQGFRCGTTYAERLPYLLDTEPDIVFISGGVNDMGATETQIADAVAGTYRDLQQAFPDAEIFAVGGIYFTGEERPALLQFLNDEVEQAAADIGATYVDIGEPLLGRPDLMADDRQHPNPDGHRVIAEATREAARMERYSPG
jgi:lysophospholipase L1-like esterase